jgi:prolyl-tRNA synthetase
VMTHSDDDGLVLPPKLAPKHVVLLPIYRSDQDRAQVLAYCESLLTELGQQQFSGGPVKAWIDDRDLRGGEKAWQHIKRGVPLRVEVGPKDIAQNAVFRGRRDTGERRSIERNEFVRTVGATLDQMQQDMFQRALRLRQENTRQIDNLEEFKAYFTPHDEERPEIHGGFALCHWVEDPATAELLKALKLTIRCIPFDRDEEPGPCLFTGRPSPGRVIIAKAY